MPKDDRMHGVIRDKKLQVALRKRMRLDGITFEEMVRRYTVFPEDDKLRKEYTELENKVVKAYQNDHLRTLMEVFWAYLMKGGNGEYDVTQIVNTLLADMETGTYKKKGRYEQLLELQKKLEGGIIRP